MAVENFEGGTIVTGEHVRMFSHIALASRLGLEVSTGMAFRGSSMNMAKQVCGSAKRTKKGVLADYVKWLGATYPDYRPAPSVVKALGK